MPGASLARHMALFAFPERAMCVRPLALQRSIQATYMNALTKYNYMRTPAQTSHTRSHTAPLMPLLATAHLRACFVLLQWRSAKSLKYS